ncbi:MAG: alanine--tRNA ligase-related protein, partial [Patescibacteria group bacterium]
KHKKVHTAYSLNKDRGYILRRLLRRVIFHLVRVANDPVNLQLPRRDLDLSGRVAEIIKPILETVIETSPYLEKGHAVRIDSVIKREIGTSIDLLRSTSELRKAIDQCLQDDVRVFPADIAFKIFSSYGIPPDFIRDEAEKIGLEFREEDFEKERKKHQEISRAGQEKKFGGHGLLLDTGELKATDEKELKIVTRLHTATHLLQAALRAVLGEEVKQMGSDITAERTRFDFTFERKLTPEEIKKVEDWVNDKIQKDLPMQYIEMPYEEAKKTGALHFFKEKYPEKVKVYFAGESLDKAVSKEFCGGPHVGHTGEIGKFKIAKEEAVGAGVRRIRGAVE